jgi:hypothetical protein
MAPASLLLPPNVPRPVSVPGSRTRPAAFVAVMSFSGLPPRSVKQAQNDWSAALGDDVRHQQCLSLIVRGLDNWVRRQTE